MAPKVVYYFNTAIFNQFIFVLPCKKPPGFLIKVKTIDEKFNFKDMQIYVNGTVTKFCSTVALHLNSVIRILAGFVVEKIVRNRQLIEFQ